MAQKTKQRNDDSWAVGLRCLQENITNSRSGLCHGRSCVAPTLKTTEKTFSH